MKKRINFINAIILFFGLTIFLIISVFIVSDYNYDYQEKELKNHIKLIAELYHGDNEAEIIGMYSKSHSNLRITFIELDGTVKADSSNSNVFENHLERPELNDLGNIYKRKSTTLNQTMLYIAYIDEGLWIRVAMPMKSITALTSGFIIASTITLVFISVFSIWIINLANKKALSPLNVVVKKLAAIPGYQGSYSDDIESISTSIDDINNLINDKMNSIIDEKSKVNFIINNLNQGVIVTNSEGIIILVNKFILDLVSFSLQDIVEKNYIYLIRDITLQERIEDTINQGTSHSFDMVIEQKIYFVEVKPSTSKWTGENTNKFGAFIFINDLTEERKVEKIKREFFANASHELKSPLTTIIGYQQMITEGIITTSEEILDASNRTIKEASRMHQIILEMLDLSKLESKETTNLENINIKDVVLEIIGYYNKEIENKKLVLNLDLKDLILHMNYSHLNQLVRNLIENAIKYNIDGGTIEVAINPKTREFIVKDTGIGISTENQSRVFERFYMVDKARSKEQGGTGLGLAIVKHIGNLYDANIILTSKLEKGTRIKIQFNSASVLKEDK